MEYHIKKNPCYVSFFMGDYYTSHIIIQINYDNRRRNTI